LIPHLCPEDLLQSVDTALKLPNQRDRWMILHVALPVLNQHPRITGRVVQTELADLLSEANASRSSVLSAIAHHKTFSPPFVADDTLRLIGAHIVDICRNWLWE